MQLRFLEKLSTKYLLHTVIATIAVIVVITSIILALQLTSVDNLAKYADMLFKSTAVVVGTIWALNRYFITRTDAPQLKADASLAVVPGTKFNIDAADRNILLVHLTIANTSKALFSHYEVHVQIERVLLSKDDLMFDRLYPPVPPKEGEWHLGRPIEPGSSIEFDVRLSVPSDAPAVNIVVIIRAQESGEWSWHKTIAIPSGNLMPEAEYYVACEDCSGKGYLLETVDPICPWCDHRYKLGSSVATNPKPQPAINQLLGETDNYAIVETRCPWCASFVKSHIKKIKCPQCHGKGQYRA